MCNCKIKINELSHVPFEKDISRIDTILNKYFWNTENPDEDTASLKFKSMANKIKDYDKAMRRGKYLEDINFHDYASIFFTRAEQIRFEMGESVSFIKKILRESKM